MSGGLSHARMRELFEEMVTAFGRMELDRFQSFMTADAIYEWPYLPVPGWPHRMQGTAEFAAMTAKGMADFGGLNHKVRRFYDLVEPDTLIVEYYSDTVHGPSGRRYANEYLGIVRFEGEKMSYWKEYIVPSRVAAVMGA